MANKEDLVTGDIHKWDDEVITRFAIIFETLVKFDC